MSDRDTKQFGVPDLTISPLRSLPVAATTKIEAGKMVGIDSSGNAGHLSATFSIVQGVAEKVADNTTGAAGDIQVIVRRGTFALAQTGTTIDKSKVGQLVYGTDPVTVTLTASSNPFAGFVDAVANGVVYYAIGVGQPGLGAASQSVAGFMSVADKTFEDGLHAAKGADLTDASPTITLSQGTWRVLPAATLSTGRTVTLGTSGASAGDQITITRLDVTANTYAVVNGGGGAGTLVTFPVSKIGFARCQYDGTNWALREVGSL